MVKCLMDKLKSCGFNRVKFIHNDVLKIFKINTHNIKLRLFVGHTYETNKKSTTHLMKTICSTKRA